MKVVIINGQPRAGKDLFVYLCQQHCTWCLNVSAVDFVKEVAKYCGWDGEKTPHNRKFLSDLKDLLTKWNDVPYQKVLNSIQQYESKVELYDFDPNTEAIVFVHSREPQEIARYAKEIGAYSLLIRRPSIENEEQSNHADAEVFNYDYDFTIINDGTVEDLEEKAFNFLSSMGIKNLT